MDPSTDDLLTRALQRVRRRMTVAAWLERLAALALWSFVLASAYAVVTRVVHTLPPPEWVGLSLLGAAMAGAAVWAMVKRPGLLAAAVTSDEALDAKERLSSALLLRGRAKQDPMAAALLADAHGWAATLDPRRVCPARLPRRSRGAALAGLCFLGLLLVPQLSWFMKPSQRALRAEETRQARKLKKLAKRLERTSPRAAPKDRAKLAKRLKALAKQMKRGRLGKAEALKQYRKLTKEAEALQRKLANANTLKQKLTAQALANLRDALDPTQGSRPLSEGVRAALSGLPRKLRSGELTPAQRQRLAKALKRAAEAMKKAGNTAAAEALARAAAQCRAGNGKAAAAAVAEALAEMEGALTDLEAMELSDELLAELIDGRMDLAMADDICPNCGKPSALCTCEKCEYG